MNIRVKPPATVTERDLPFECIALVLQGGGALGAYQAGVYEALAGAGIYPDWVAGLAVIAGTAGFFAPRYPPPWLYPSGTVDATSFYDTRQLKDTLERFVDFDRLNAGAIRPSVGTVNVRSGNFVYFDTQTHTIGPEHIMASGALPPSFSPIEIEGEHYWDGGLVSNTPLQWIVESRPRLDTLAFQVDLWSARGALPRNLTEVSTGQKDIQYSSRTRAGTGSFKRIQRLRRAAADLLDKLPDDLRRGPEAALLRSVGDRKVYNIVHLIYRASNYEGPAKDYEFSRQSMEEHWRAGYYDAVRTLRHPEAVGRPTNDEGVFTFDLHVDGGE